MEKKKMHIPVSLGIASVWFGTHAGPGAAAGTFAATYFSRYGKWGLLAPFLAVFLMGICIYYGIEYSRIKGLDNFSDFTESFFQPYGKLFSGFFEITFLAGVTLALAAGIATAAEIINQYSGIPYAIAALLVIAISVILSIFGEELVRASSTVMTIFIVVCLAAISIAGLASSNADFMGQWRSVSFSDFSLFDSIKSAFIYAGVLTAGVVANSIAVSSDLKDQKDSRDSAVIGYIMNLFLIMAVVLLLFAYPQHVDTALPNYLVVEDLNAPILLFAYVALVVLAVLSTIVSYTYTIASRYSKFLPMKEGTGRDLTTILIFFGITYFISLIGLSAIIGKGYTYLGYAAIPSVILPIMLLGHSKTKKAREEMTNSKTSSQSVRFDH